MELTSENFRFVEIVVNKNEHYSARKFILEEWCPQKRDWCKMLLPGNWAQIHQNTNTLITDEDCVVSKKFLKRLNNRLGGVIICKEKHDTSYYNANTTEMIGLASLSILGRRFNEGCYSFEIEKPIEPKYLPINFNEETLQNACKTQWNTYTRVLEYYKENKNFTQKVEKALKDDDYQLATQLLMIRDGYEYEGFVIEPLTRVNFD